MSQYQVNYKIEAGAAQHIGNRAQQQDRTGIFTSKIATGYVLAVLADGGGGAETVGGKIAAEQVMHTCKQLFEAYNPERVKLHELLQNIVTEAHTMIKLNGMSSKTEPHSTLVVLIMTPNGDAIWAHIGDSRLYRFHGKQLQEKTTDQAYIEHLTADGKITREAAKNHRRSQLLMNALGTHIREPYLTIGEHRQLQAGDAFLLCSDGLWHYFADEELAAVLALKTPKQASEMLIEKAQERAKGKGDNCSMVIVKLVKPPPQDPGYRVEKLTRAV